MLNKWQKKTLTIVGGIVLLLILVVYGTRVIQRAGFSDPQQFNDFTVYFSAAQTLSYGGDPYEMSLPEIDRRQYLYTPMFAIVMVMLTWMGYETAIIFWYITNLIFFAAAVALAVLTVREGKKSVSVWVWLLPLLLIIRVADSNFLTGQANALTAGFLLAGLFSLRQGKDKAAGIFIAASAMIKLTPIIFLAYFAYKRMWTAFRSGVLWFGIFLFLVPMMFFLPPKGAALTLSYGKSMAAFLAGGTTDGAPGQSIFAVGQRYLTETNAIRHADKPMYVNFVNLPRGVVVGIVFLLAALLIYFTARKARVPEEPRDSFSLGLEMSVVMLLMLLISPLSRKAHFIVLILPLSASVYYLFYHYSGEKWGGVLLGALGLFAATFILSSETFVGEGIDKVLLAYSVFFFGTLGLYAAQTGLLGEVLRKEQSYVPSNPPI